MTATIVKPRAFGTTVASRGLATVGARRCRVAPVPSARIGGLEDDRKLAMRWSMVDGRLTARWC